MSGPKSGSWCVIQMSEAEARASRQYAMEQLRYYLECILSFRDKLARLQREHPELQLHTEVDRIVDPSSEDAEQIVAELNNRYEIYIRLRDEINNVENTLNNREHVAFLINRTLKARGTKAQVKEYSNKEQLASIFDKAKSLFEVVHEQTALARRTEIENLLEQCLKVTDQNLAELLLTDLRVRIRRANQETQELLKLQEERRQRDVHEAQNLLQLLGRIDKAIAEPFQNELKSVLLGETQLTDNLRQGIRVAVETVEREYAGKILRETLEELGYEVLEGFETLFAAGGASYFQRASWDEHHIRVTVDSKSQRLSLIPVRYGEDEIGRVDQALRDREMEEAWCGEVPDVLNKLASKGIEIDLVRRFAPGERAIELINDEKLKSSRAKRRNNHARNKQ